MPVASRASTFIDLHSRVGRAGAARMRKMFAVPLAAFWRMPRWVADQIGWPLVAFLVANVLLVVLRGDRWIADTIYAAEGGRWALQDSVVTTTLIHIAGKRLSTLAFLLVVASAVLSWRMPRLARLRAPLVQLAVSVALAAVAVSVLKHFTRMDCPWDMQRYGGIRPYLDLLDTRPSGMKASGCFPAGHASAGYAWVALYFFAVQVAPQWRWPALWSGLLLGGVFGVSQQLRGAHFLSHDVWTLMVCWLVAVMDFHRPWRQLGVALPARSSRRDASPLASRAIDDSDDSARLKSP